MAGKHGLAVALVVLAGSLYGTAAHATVITLDSLQTDSFLGGSCTTTAATTCTQDVDPGPPATYGTRWTGGNGTTESSEFALSGLAIPFVDGDQFALVFINSNGSVWDFQLRVETTVGTFLSPATAIAAGFDAQLGAFLTGLGDGTIQQVYAIVSGPVPNFANPAEVADRSVDFNLKPVPEPGTLLLLGSGLLGASRLRRRRRQS